MPKKRAAPERLGRRYSNRGFQGLVAAYCTLLGMYHLVDQYQPMPVGVS